MLKIHVMKGPKGADYYLNLASEDFFFNGGEPPGEWYGKGATYLRLEGLVDEQSFRRVFNGFDPLSGRALVQNAGDPGRQNALGLVLSLPKSYAAVWSQASHRVRAIMDYCEQEAVRATLDYLQEKAAFTRRGHGGDELEKANLIFSTWTHGTSRGQEPQPHTHITLHKVCVRDDGSTGTIEAREVFRHMMAAGALFRAQAAALLQANLGFEIEPDRGEYFKITGVSEPLCAAFSTRRNHIAALMKEKGFESARASDIANFATRPEKQHLPRKDLLEKWQAIGRVCGWSTEQCAKLEGKYRKPADLEAKRKRAIETAFQKLTVHQSYFSERTFVHELSKEAIGTGLTAHEIQEAVQMRMQGFDVQAIGQVRGEPCFTTDAILREERALMAAVKNGVNATEHMIQLPASILARKDLSQEQRKAVIQIVGGKGNIAVVSGLAGTGKSTMLKAARECWEAQGFVVIGAAVTGKASQELSANAGIKSRTLAATLKDLESGSLLEVRQHTIFPNAPKWNPATGLEMPYFAVRNDFAKLDSKTVLVLDEASTIGTSDMRKIVDAVNRSGAKLILTGDERQLPPIQSGAPFRAMADELGRTELSEIQRQKEQWAKDLVKDFAAGNIAKAWLDAERLKLINRSDSHEKARQKLIDHWKEKGVEHPQENLILAATNDDANQLNRLAQDERRKANTLGLIPHQIGDETFRKGDRVRFAVRDRIIGFENGDCATITRINAEEMRVLLDAGRRLIIPLQRYADRDPEIFGNKPWVKLGYASTVYSAQGTTTRNAYILLDPNLQTRELSYVQASRASATTRFYLDRHHEQDILQAMRTSHEKPLASMLKDANEKNARHRSRQVEKEIREREEREMRRKEEEQRRREREEMERRQAQERAGHTMSHSR